MENRDDAVLEIMERIHNELTNNPPYKDFQLVHFELTPVDPIGTDNMPAVLVFEDEDVIIKRATRNNLGFPLVRSLSLMVEVWDLDKTRVKQLYRSVRKGMLKNEGRLDNASIIEKKTVGPFSSGRDGTMGMRLITDITYNENEL